MALNVTVEIISENQLRKEIVKRDALHQLSIAEANCLTVFIQVWKIIVLLFGELFEDKLFMFKLTYPKY